MGILTNSIQKKTIYPTILGPPPSVFRELDLGNTIVVQFFGSHPRHLDNCCDIENTLFDRFRGRHHRHLDKFDMDRDHAFDSVWPATLAI